MAGSCAPWGAEGATWKSSPYPLLMSSLPSPFELSWSQHLPVLCHQPRGPQPTSARSRQGSQGLSAGLWVSPDHGQALGIARMSEGISEGTLTQ